MNEISSNKDIYFCSYLDELVWTVILWHDDDGGSAPDRQSLFPVSESRNKEFTLTLTKG